MSESVVSVSESVVSVSEGVVESVQPVGQEVGTHQVLCTVYLWCRRLEHTTYCVQCTCICGVGCCTSLGNVYLLCRRLERARRSTPWDREHRGTCRKGSGTVQSQYAVY